MYCFLIGETAYVLTDNPEPGTSGFWLWNPSTGIHYNQYQPHIPLISVGCIFNDRNVRLEATPRRLAFYPVFYPLMYTKTLTMIH